MLDASPIAAGIDSWAALLGARGLKDVNSWVRTNFTQSDRVSDFLRLLIAQPFDRLETVVDTFCFLLERVFKFKEDETDLVVMKVEITVSLHEKVEKHSATLVVSGTPNGHSAMSRTVALPVGIATRLLLTHQLMDRGVTVPLSKAWYSPILVALSEQGIQPVYKIEPFLVQK